MTFLVPTRPKAPAPPDSHSLCAAVVLLAGLLLPAQALLGIKMLAGQEPVQGAAQPAAAAAPHKQAPAQHRNSARGKRTTAPPAPPAAQAAPVAPVLPDWPANQKPRDARITWDSRGLKIDASNSSLDQILHEVATDTGAKIDGFNRDQRIFGTYGPGPAREVLSRLLDGTGYNVLMIGGQGDAPPRQIILSSSTPASLQQSSASAQKGSEEEDNDAEEQQPAEPQPAIPQETPQPTPIRNPFGGARTPQQIQLEQMQRQQQPQPPDQQQFQLEQMQREQHQQPPDQQQNNPPQ